MCVCVCDVTAPYRKTSKTLNITCWYTEKTKNEFGFPPLR